MLPATLHRWFPFLAWPRPDRALLQGEFWAGLTVGLMLVPQGVAYAALAGMPLVTGIYASLLPGLVAVLWGSSTRLGVGPTALTSLLIGTSLSGLAAPGSAQWVSLAVWMALLSGALQLVLGLVRFGWLLNLVTSPVLSGFTQAAALLILAAANRQSHPSTRDRLPLPNRKPQPLPEPLRTGERKVEHDMAMARLAAEIHLRSARYARRPSRKFVSASTQEYAWATYLRAWVDRAERVGNLNYPDEARRRRLSGTVVLNIGIRRNGAVERVDIVQSSGIPLLDESALRIAKLAEPYPPLPKTQENPDILNVVRTWRFLPGGEMVDE